MELEANWIWSKAASPFGYNQIISAKKNFTVSAAVKSIETVVTADSFYRLFINGVWVCDGPARGWPNHYYYDQPDISQYIRAGSNEIKIISCYYGTGHFHGIPKQAGLLFQLNIDFTDGSSLEIITDDSWQVSENTGWQRNSPKISCQMPAAEYYDSNYEKNIKYENAAVICKAGQGSWQNLRRRDVRMLSKIETDYERLVAKNILQRYDSRCTFCFLWAKNLYPLLIQANRRLMPAFALATVIKTDTDMDIAVDLTDYRSGNYGLFIDGGEITGQRHLSAGRHLVYIYSRLSFNHMTDLTVSFTHSSDFKLVNPHNSTLTNPWSFLAYNEFKCAEDDIVWQKYSSKFQACIDGYSALADRHSRITDISEFASETKNYFLSLPCSQMFGKDNYHRFIRRCCLSQSSVDIMPAVVEPAAEGDVELVYDLGKQNIGYYNFEIESQQDVEIDIYQVEYISPDGKVQFTDEHRNGMTYITKEGLNVFTSLKRRAGRYVFVRFVNQSRPVEIKKFNFIESTYPVEYFGSFKCSDERLNRIWEISAHSLKLCMEDTFTDCPLYEQTLWVGDARNESLFGYGVFGSTDIARRCILLGAESLETLPLVGSQVPSSWRCILPAWSFLWTISVWDYYWYTKDIEFLADMWPYAVKNFKNASAMMDSNGLFSEDFWNFFDWSKLDDGHKTVLHNSMLMVGALSAAIDCGNVLKNNTDWMQKLREELKSNLNRFYNKAKKSYPDSIYEDGTVSQSISQHMSFLALLYDIATCDMTEDLLGNVVWPPSEMTKVGSPFVIFYMYQMLEKYGRFDFIMQSIYDNYEPMLASGATTVWESFASGTLSHDTFPTRSHCHGWSAAPLYFLPRLLLGIKFVSAGCKKVEISPYFCEHLDWAKGSFKTPDGVVEVSWQRDSSGKAQLSYALPESIELVAAG